MQTLIIGDIHGCYAELLELLDRAAIGADDLVVSVGDLVDRGPDPGPVLDLFRTRPNTLAILGNHELNLLRDERKHGNDWFWNECSERDARFSPCALVTSDDARRDMLGFFASLPLMLSRPDLRPITAASPLPSAKGRRAPAAASSYQPTWSHNGSSPAQTSFNAG